MPPDTIVYVFRDNNDKWLATLSEDEARAYVTPAFRHRGIERMTLEALHRRDPHAFVRTRNQYYWAQDLMTGAARGALA